MRRLPQAVPIHRCHAHQLGDLLVIELSQFRQQRQHAALEDRTQALGSAQCRGGMLLEQGMHGLVDGSQLPLQRRLGA